MIKKQLVYELLPDAVLPNLNELGLHPMAIKKFISFMNDKLISIKTDTYRSEENMKRLDKMVNNKWK